MADHGWALVAGWAASPVVGLPLIDWLAIAMVLAGLIGGALSGLLRSFSTLLWLLAALWLGSHLASQFVSWMPNSVQPYDLGATLVAFGLIAASVMLLPLVARIIGGAAGKKKTGAEAKHKAFGAVVGLVCALLVFVWMAPFMHRYNVFARHWILGHAPPMAASIADGATWLFPEAHRIALRKTLRKEQEWGFTDRGAEGAAQSK